VLELPHTSQSTSQCRSQCRSQYTSQCTSQCTCQCTSQCTSVQHGDFLRRALPVIKWKRSPLGSRLPLGIGSVKGYCPAFPDANINARVYFAPRPLDPRSRILPQPPIPLLFLLLPVIPTRNFPPHVSLGFARLISSVRSSLLATKSTISAF
jgi:hypothetical protein